MQCKFYDKKTPLKIPIKFRFEKKGEKNHGVRPNLSIQDKRVDQFIFYRLRNSAWIFVEAEKIYCG